MIKIKTLENNVKLVYEHLPYVRSVSIGIWVKNGSRYEDISENGISHFIEHLLFKGTTNRTQKEIAWEIDRRGGIINAATAKEYTCYYTRTLDDHFDVALSVLSDMFFNSLFDEGEIKKECNVILEEINMYEDAPDDFSYELLTRNVFENSSLGRPILGCRETISKFEHRTFIDFLRKRYIPENTIISVAGNFTEAEMIEKVENAFSHFKSSNIPDEVDLSNKYTRSIVSKERDIEQIHLNIAFKGVEGYTSRTYDMSVFNAFLGIGMSSILNQKIREERGLCYAIFSGNASYSDTGLFSIYSGLNPKKGNEAIDTIIEELSKIKRDLISKELLQDTKEQIKSNYILSLESSSSRMQSLGRSLTINGKVNSPDDIMNLIDAVTMESLENVINDVVNFDEMSLSAVGNLKYLDLERYR